MCTQQDVGVVKGRELLVVNGDKTRRTQALYLTVVMHDISKTIEWLPILQFLFCLSDGACYAKAKT